MLGLESRVLGPPANDFVLQSEVYAGSRERRTDNKANKLHSHSHHIPWLVVHHDL
jgi:hypothetical protein